jgi:hypothetical protein
VGKKKNKEQSMGWDGDASAMPPNGRFPYRRPKRTNLYPMVGTNPSHLRHNETFLTDVYPTNKYVILENMHAPQQKKGSDKQRLMGRNSMMPAISTTRH